MINNTSSIVSKVWSFCNPLRDVGVGYGDYLEQLTYLLFLKMADEYSKPPYNRQFNFPRLKDEKNNEIAGGDFCKWDNPANRYKRIEIFNAETNPEGRWRKFTYEEIINRENPV